jgi:cytochrome c oxidase subunit 2
MKYLFNFLNMSYCDASIDWQLGVQEPATPIAEGIIHFHNYLMFYIIIIVALVFWLLFRIVYLFNEESNSLQNVQKFSHSSMLEIVWTIIPAIVLLFLAIPSFALLYSLDEIIDPDVTLKIIGHQWYWSYEYSDYSSLYNGKSLAFDSYMISTSDLTERSLSSS